jgi:hypothetical protein
MDRPLLPPFLHPAVAALAALVAAGLAVGLSSPAGPLGLLALDPWQAAGHGLTLGLLVLLADDTRRCERWRREARDVGPGDDTWASQAVRLCQERAQPPGDREQTLTELGKLRDQLSRWLTTRWAGRYVILSCLPAVLGLVAGFFALGTLQAQPKSYLQVFGPTLVGSAEALVAGALAYLVRMGWEDVLDVWYDAAVDQIAPDAVAPTVEPSAQQPSPA